MRQQSQLSTDRDAVLDHGYLRMHVECEARLTLSWVHDHGGHVTLELGSEYLMPSHEC